MWDWIAKLAELHRQNQLAVLVTVTKTTGSTPRKQGAKMIVLPDGSFHGSVGGGVPEYYVLKEAMDCLQQAHSRLAEVPLQKQEEFPACGGTMEIYMEVINSNPTLYLFGAGHIAQSLCQVLEGTPFTVHLVDEREEWINAAGIPAATIRHKCHWSDFVEQANWSDKRSYVAIMTYDGTIDQQVLEEVLPHPTRFLGMVGSKGKWSRIEKNMSDSGLDLSRVFCPVGHDNGGNAPREIAISIASQILSVHYGRA